MGSARQEIARPATGTVVAILYRRASTEDQKRRGFSLPEQRRECLRRAQDLAAGAELTVLEFEDNSSGEFIGEQLDAARDLARKGGVQYFICLHPDRFARNLMHQLVVYEDLRRAGCQVVFVQAEFADTPEGKLFFSITGAVSEYEKAKIKERTARGRRGKLSAGGIPNRVAPYGYDWDKQAKRPVVNPQEAAWVRQMFRWADGQTEDRQPWGARRPGGGRNPGIR